MNCPTLVAVSRLAVSLAVLCCLCQVSLVAAADCNENGAADDEDIAAARSEDCNDDGVPDECEFAPLNFGRGETLAAGDAPEAVLATDLDGDGLADLVTGNQARDSSSSLWVFLNRGDGTFPDGVEYAAGENLSAVVAADLDSDGDIDIASANSTEVLVFANQGGGVLAEPLVLAVPRFTRFVTAADVTGDGVLDLVVSNTSQDTVSVLAGSGAGTFAAPVAHAVGESPRQVAFGDLDGDGNLDLVSANWSSRSVSVLAGIGSGTLRRQTSYDTGQPTRALKIADLSGDGSPDLVVETSSGLLYLENSGTGTFMEPVDFGLSSRFFSLADVDGDGDVDLAVGLADGRSLVVLANDGSGRFVTSLTLNVEMGHFATGNLDSDGDLDIVFTVPDSAEVGLLFNGGGALSMKFESLPAETPHDAVVADFDGDGYDDIATPDGPSGYLSVYPNLTDGTFGPRQRYPISTGGHLESIAAGDVDGDSDIDLAISDRRLHYVAVLLGAGDGTFAPATRFETGRQPWAVMLGDLDGDGFLDLVTANGIDNSLTLYMSDGAGGFVDRQDLTVGVNPGDVEHGDLDGDGHADLVTSSGASGEVFILWGDGSGGFSEPASILVPAGPASLRVDDLEGDGDRDIVGVAREMVVVLLGDGTGNFALPRSFPLTSAPSKISTGDVNLDGVVDLLIPYWGPDTLVVWLGAGDGTYAPPIEFAIGSLPKVALVSDLDHDGDMDIVCANRGRPQEGAFEDIAVLYNQTGAPLFERDYLPQVCTALDFEKVSAPRGGGVVGGGVVERATEYLLPTRDDETLPPSLYQNARRFATQREFLRSVFPERFGDLAAPEYSALVEKRETRQYHGGTISRLRSPSGIAYGFDVFTDEAEPAELLSLAETRALLERLGVSFALRPLGYLPGTTEARELASSWADPGFPVFLIEESGKEPEPEPGAPTFTLEVPDGMEICGTFAEAGADRGVRQEYELKSRLRLRGGTFSLPTAEDSFAGTLFEEVRFGLESEVGQQVAQPSGEGTFRLVRVPGLAGVTTYRFFHAQAFVLGDGRELEIALVSPLQYRGRGDEALDEPFVFTDEFFTVLTGREAIQATLDGVPSVRYGSCTYDTLPQVEVSAELEDGTTVRLIERFREAASEADTAPVGLVRAEIVVGAQRRLVNDYWSLVYSAFRHNTGPSYWVLFGEPLTLPGVDGDVHGVELVTKHLPLRTAAEASYLDANLQTLGQTGVRALSRRTLTTVARFRRGDANADGELNVLDALELLEHLFRRGPALSCVKSGDANDDGRLNILDATVLVSQLFGGRGSLPPPFAGCGDDPSADGLRCDVHTPCE